MLEKPLKTTRRSKEESRLVSNLIIFKDIIEKDKYKMSNRIDLIGTTQRAGLMTAFDLKKLFYNI